MLQFALVLGVFAGPTNCPTDVGQIRWDGVTYEVPGQRMTVRGTIWDRDRNGRPSHGDLMKIESATQRGRDLTDGETWIVMKGRLAHSMAQSFRRKKPESARCETRFNIRGVPTIASAGRLGRFLRQQSANSGQNGDAKIKETMLAHVDRICRKGVNTPREILSKKLYRIARRTHRRPGKAHLRRLADEVASEFSLKCGHLDILSDGQLTF